MQRSDILEEVEQRLADVDEIAFAYLHGSSLTQPNPHDVDIAVFLREDLHALLVADGRLTMEFTIPLEIALESELGMSVDVQVINSAPLTFRARVVNAGVVVVDRLPDRRADFEYLSRYEYFDFRPRRQEYLAEVMA